MRILPAAATIIAATALTASCSDNDKALTTLPTTSPSATTHPSPTSPPTTTAPPTTTTAPGTTAPPDTATPPPVDEATRQAIIQAAIDSEEAWLFAQQDPTDQARIDALTNSMTGYYLTEAQLLLFTMASERQHLILNEQNPAQIVPDVDTIKLHEDNKAEIDVCIYDASIIMEKQLEDGFPDLIIDDQVVKRRHKQIFLYEGGQWRLDSYTLLSKEMGETPCEKY